MRMLVLADSLPYQPHTATGYGWSGISGLLVLGAIFWIAKSGGSNRSSGSSGSSSSSSSSGRGGVSLGVIVLVVLSLWAFSKSQDNPGTSPAPPSTTVTTPHKSTPAPKKSTPHKSGSGGSSCSLVCFHN